MKSNHIDEYVSSGTSPTACTRVSKKKNVVYLSVPSLLQPQLPSWLNFKFPPFTLDTEVASLVAGKEMLPLSWAKRQRRTIRLQIRDARRLAIYQRSERRLERILSVIEERIFFPNQPLTVRTISGKPLPPPNWSGDVNPVDVHRCSASLLPSSVPSKAFMLNLVHRYGYNLDAALSPFASESGGAARQPKSNGPTLPEVTRESLMKAVSKMKTRNPNLRLAVVEVITGKESGKVAKRYGLKLESLQVSVSRVRQRMDSIYETRINTGD